MLSAARAVARLDCPCLSECNNSNAQSGCLPGGEDLASVWSSMSDFTMRRANSSTGLMLWVSICKRSAEHLTSVEVADQSILRSVAH